MQNKENDAKVVGADNNFTECLAVSPYYPLSETGSLCPYLNDADFLIRLLKQGSNRLIFKKFCKAKKWAGKPNFPLVMNEEVLKRLFQSACNSADARYAMSAFDTHISLGRIIYDSVMVLDRTLHEACIERLDRLTGSAYGKRVITPEMFREVIAEHVEGEQHHEPLHLLALSLAMANQKQSAAYIDGLLQHFPDSAASMGCIHEKEDSPEQPIESKINDTIEHSPTQTTDLFCPLALADEWNQQVHAFKSAFDEYRSVSNQIAAAIDLKEFSDAGPIDALVSALTCTRRTIAKTGVEIGKILEAECRHPDGLECAFIKKMSEFRQYPKKQAGQLIEVASNALETATSVKNLGESAGATLASLESQAKRHLRQLGRADDDGFGKPLLVFPCEALEAISSMQERVARLKDELDTTLTNAQAELQAQLDALEQEGGYRAVSGASQFNEQIAEIRRSLRLANEMSAINDCRSQILALENALRGASATSDSKRMTDAVFRLQSNREDTVAVLDLCETLLDQGLHDTALLILLNRQHVYFVEEIGAEPDRAIGALVEAVCRSGAAARCHFPDIWHTVCVSPWLLAIKRNDLTSADLIERLAIMYVAEALSGTEENSAIGLLNLGMSDRSDLSLPPSVNAMIDAIVSRRSFRVVTTSISDRIDEKRRVIEECIAFDNGKYRHIQCTKATHFARFEAVEVFPELERFWKAVSEALAGRRLKEASSLALSADPDEWIALMNKRHDREMQPHPHFSAKIQSFVANFIELVRDYLDECTGATQQVDIVINEQVLREELEKWAGSNATRYSVAKCFTEQSLGVKINSGGSDPFETLLLSREVILSCPSAVAWSLSQKLLQPALDLEARIIDDLGQARSQGDIDALLCASRGWAHLQILWHQNDQGHELNYARKEEIERQELWDFRPQIIEYTEGSFLETYDACCNAGRFAAARKIQDECTDHLAKESSARIESAAARAISMLNELEHIKELAEDKGMPSEWVESVYAQASGIERSLKQFQRAVAKDGQIDSCRLSHLQASLRALTVLVRERSNSFAAVKFHLEGGNPDSTASRGREVTEHDAQVCCPDLLEAWEKLRSCSADRVGAAWAAFAKKFGKHCNLYHDENDPINRFKTVSSFDYPYSTYQTQFYKPKSEFLKRPLRFYVYRDDVDNQARQRLDIELAQEQSAAWLHVIFAPSGSDKLRKAFQFDRNFRSVLVIDDAFLYQICVEDKHDVPVRRGLHGVVADLVSSSPFVANGYCHQENNIYVGRSEVIQRLLNNPQAMIWGGRRIGKTSVLHALESTLAKRHYHVALVYADVQDSVDPDLAIAQRLTEALGLPPIKSVSEFVQQIQSERKKGSKFAFLLDEVDEYIKKSRLAHDGEFPLASVLRQIVMEDPTKSTVLVYSGYHQLYFEAKLDKSKKRVGHPFVNIASDFPIRDLSHDEVVELVKTGFEEMLGIDLHPDVPSLVAEKASCHPAFVQEFCRCLLSHVSRRRSYPQSKITISAKDVEEVYKADGRGDGGEQPFIFYVDETLGYNLSDLGRAIMLTIESDKYYKKSEIYKDLSVYADISGVEQPREDHFSDTIDLLVMTNLLTQDPRRIDYYRMTYPTFIEILGRLNKLGKTEIEKSLKSYDKNERNKGILR